MTRYHQLLIGGAFLLGALGLGLLTERVIVALLKRLAAKIEWRTVGIATSAIRGVIVIWFVLAAASVATEKLGLSVSVYVSKSAILLAIGSGSIAVARLAVGFVELYGRRTEPQIPAISIFSNLAALLVLVIGLLVALQLLGIPITPILTALGVGGLAVALALQDTLSNLFAGLQILATRQVRPGHYVRLDSGHEGYVRDISWRSTVIQALQNNLIIVPNSKLSAAIITNFSLPVTELAVNVPVKVGYQSDLLHVEQITVEVAREVQKTTEGAVTDFEPFIRYHTFGESGVEFTVVMRASEFSAQFVLKHEFVRKLVHRFEAERIVIPVPQLVKSSKPDA